MNIGSTPCTGARNVDLQLSNGKRKSMAPSSNDSEVSLAKPLALKSLALNECIVCFDVHERTLQTRCCKAIICAFCYLSLTAPKKCPADRTAFSGAIQDDLEPAGKLVDQQVELMSAVFNDIESIETALGKEMAQAQNMAFSRLQASGNNTLQVDNQSVDDTQTVRSPNHNVNIASSIGRVIIGNNNRLTIRGERFIPNYSVGSIIRLPTRDLTHSGFSSRHQPGTVRTFNYLDNGSYGLLDVKVDVGNIVITRQDSDRQNTVSIVASKEPKLSRNELSVRLGIGCLELKLPEEFSKTVNIATNAGSICTQGDYSIKSGGEIRTITSGNVNIKIDSQLVKVNAQCNTGYINIKDTHQSCEWERRELLVATNYGNIIVIDR